MIRKKAWRYYCEHCKKSKGTRQSMELHEEHCTANPNRKCRMCYGANAARNKRIVDEALAMFGGLTIPEDALGWDAYEKRETGILAFIDAEVEHCPACTLAAIRSCKVLNKEFCLLSWDYKEAADAWHKEALQNRRNEEQ